MVSVLLDVSIASGVGFCAMIKLTTRASRRVKVDFIINVCLKIKDKRFVKVGNGILHEVNASDRKHFAFKPNHILRRRVTSAHKCRLGELLLLEYSYLSPMK